MARLSGYRFEETLHEGVGATWFRATREEDGKLVLLKVLASGHRSQANLDYWVREHALLQDLRIAGVLRLLELHLDAIMCASVFEHFPGEPLKRRQHLAKLSVSDVLAASILLAKTLGEIHAAKIVHKDVNPLNILFDGKTGQVRLVGFGLASRLPRETVDSPRPSSLPGTLAYASPEQTGWMNRSVDSRSDLYSLGVTIYELLTGAVPFQHEDPLELVHAHIARQPQAPVERTPHIPEVLSEIVMKLLTKSANVDPGRLYRQPVRLGATGDDR